MLPGLWQSTAYSPVPIALLVVVVQWLPQLLLQQREVRDVSTAVRDDLQAAGWFISTGVWMKGSSTSCRVLCVHTLCTDTTSTEGVIEDVRSVASRPVGPTSGLMGRCLNTS